MPALDRVRPTFLGCFGLLRKSHLTLIGHLQ
jgi:hypothetical protein